MMASNETVTNARLASSEEMGAAVRMILGSLPAGMEIRFFWKNKQQYVEMRYSDGSVEVARLSRGANGVGTIVPEHLH